MFWYITPDRYGVLWLKSNKRGPKAAEGKIQGKGWEMYESSRSQEENLDIFQTVKKLFDLRKPITTNQLLLTFRTSAQPNTWRLRGIFRIFIVNARL